MHKLNKFSVLMNDGLYVPVAFDKQLLSRTAINRELNHSNDVMMNEN